MLVCQYASILRHPCTTDHAPVEVHNCTLILNPPPGPACPALASTVRPPSPSAASTAAGITVFDRPQGRWTNVLGCPADPSSQNSLGLFDAPRPESDGPVLIHNSPVSSSGINVSRLNTFTTLGHTSLCEVLHTLRSFTTLTLAFTSRTTTSSRYAIGWSRQQNSTPRPI
ncbi:hypothetical protein N431DRAFT_225787 [Stipitochalara longipes BDJ]|nr:hypothetical protein N431DRAFT_225787 [Stipitochalara longipes BDJ]